MRTTLAVLALALTFLVPVGVGAEARPEMVVYDYTTTTAPYCTPIIKATVEEFNAVRPATAGHRETHVLVEREDVPIEVITKVNGEERLARFLGERRSPGTAVPR